VNSRKIFFVSFVISFFDIFTTYINIVLYSTCVIEHNIVIRSICVANPVFVFTWIPVETTVIFCVAYMIQLLRAKLAVKLRVEYIFLVLIFSPVVNNTVQLLRVLK